MSKLLHAVVAIALAALCVAGCGDDRAAQWVAAMERAHASADEALEADEPDRARDALERAFEQNVPQAVHERDARVVRQDLAYRLAELELAAGRAEAAAEHASAGLELGEGEDVFTANLYIARGRAREALGREIEAAADYHEALKINDALLRRTLDE